MSDLPSDFQPLHAAIMRCLSGFKDESEAIFFVAQDTVTKAVPEIQFGSAESATGYFVRLGESLVGEGPAVIVWAVRGDLGGREAELFVASTTRINLTMVRFVDEIEPIIGQFGNEPNQVPDAVKAAWAGVVAARESQKRGYR